MRFCELPCLRFLSISPSLKATLVVGFRQQQKSLVEVIGNTAPHATGTASETRLALPPESIERFDFARLATPFVATFMLFRGQESPVGGPTVGAGR
jgi:hypothetical protein